MLTTNRGKTWLVGTGFRGGEYPIQLNSTHIHFLRKVLLLSIFCFIRRERTYILCVCLCFFGNRGRKPKRFAIITIFTYSSQFWYFLLRKPNISSFWYMYYMLYYTLRIIYYILYITYLVQILVVYYIYIVYILYIIPARRARFYIGTCIKIMIR